MKIDRLYVRYTSCGHHHARCYLVPHNFNRTFDVFLQLVNAAKTDFAELENNAIDCSIVIESNWCHGAPIIHFAAEPGGPPTGYTEVEHLALVDVNFI